MANSALKLHDIDAYYGDSHVLQRVSFELGEGRLLGLLGRNGAGKSTCMNVSVGLLPPRGGGVEVFGAAVTRLPPELIAARGVALVPQGRRVFRSLTVRENLMVAARTEHAGRRHAPWTEQTVFAMFPRLAERRGQLAGSLSGGEQQMVALGRALMLAPILVSRTIDAINEMKQRYQLTVLMAEQNFTQAIRIADRGYVIVHGKIAFEGRSMDELNNNDLIKKFYLGL